MEKRLLYHLSSSTYTHSLYELKDGRYQTSVWQSFATVLNNYMIESKLAKILSKYVPGQIELTNITICRLKTNQEWNNYFEIKILNQVDYENFLNTGFRGLKIYRLIGATGGAICISSELKELIERELDELEDIDFGREPPIFAMGTRQVIPPKDILKPEQNNKSEVSVNMYAPRVFRREKSYFVQVWMFIPKKINEIKKAALSNDPETSRLGFENLLVPIISGTKVKLTLYSEELKYSEQKSFDWVTDVCNKNFIVDIPKGLRKGKVFFVLEIYLNELIVGEITFCVSISDNTVNNLPRPIGEKSRRFKKAFISYSSKDRNEVLARVQGIASTKVFEIFQDIMELSAGERWEKRLYEEIKSCDVFFLFWSKAASQSKWVIKEMEYAIHLKKGSEFNPPRIQPVLIPPVVSPPHQLKHLHFNDKIIQFIIADEQNRRRIE